MAQPVLGTFGADASAFVTVRASTLDILTFALIIVMAPPTVLWVLERLVGLLGETSRRWFHRAAIAGLIALFVIQGLGGAAAAAATLLIAVLVGIGTTVLVVRSELARRFLGYLAFAPLLFLAMFLFFSPVNRLLFTTDPPLEGELASDNLPPIVMIVLDELPLDSLLDGEGNVDADAFPGLGELANDATFARNHTAVSPSTTSAVPAILSGKLPSDPSALPTAQDHPHSLFTLLGADYTMRAGENVTEICPPSMCATPNTENSTRTNPVIALLKASKTIFSSNAVPFNLGVSGIDPGARFEWLAGAFDDTDDRPVLHYLHTMLPHQNWDHLPDGRNHDAPDPPVGLTGNDIDDDPATAELIRQRHLLQLAYADSLVAQTLQALHEAGIYDDALVVVTSDHGVSFRPGEPTRPLSDGNFSDVLWTPLLIKEPHQHEPQVVDSPTSAIDVLPTIVDLLDVDVDWDFDGRSILGQPRPDDWEPRSFSWKYDELEPTRDGFVHVDGSAGYDEVIKSRSLDYGPEFDLRFWRWGEFGDLVGREVDSFEQSATESVTSSIDDPDRFDSVDLAAPTLPTYVSGQVSGDDPRGVAVAVNGVIGGWYDTSITQSDGNLHPFHILVPPSLLQNGHNEVSVHVIDEQDGEVLLTEAPLSP